MELELRHLRLLTAIVDSGGMTRAASLLHLTQSALSHQLKDAEERLGTQLFRREGRKLVATSAALRLVRTARHVMSEIEQAEREAREEKRERLRVSTECYTCYHWLGPIVERFRARYPNVDVDVVLDATREPIPWLLDGKLDLGIVLDVVKDRRIEYETVLEDELVLVVRRDHPLAKKPFIRAHDVADQTLLAYDVPVDELTFVKRVLKPAGVMPKRIQRVVLTEALLEMVRAGIGVSAMARWAVQGRLRDMRLVAVPIGGRRGYTRTWMAARRRGEPAPHWREFVSLLATDAAKNLAA